MQEFTKILTLFILSNIACFLAGVLIGISTTKIPKEPKEKKPITLNPKKIIKNKKQQKEVEKEFERLDTIMQNIESYDGTGANQKDVPR